MAHGNGTTPTATTLADAEALSRDGRRALDDALGHLSEGERQAYWASVRKCFNAPYEAKQQTVPPVEVVPAAVIDAAIFPLAAALVEAAAP